MRDQEPEWEKHRTKLLGAPKLRSEGVRCRISFLLFLVKPSSNTPQQHRTNFTINSIVLKSFLSVTIKVSRSSPSCQNRLQFHTSFSPARKGFLSSSHHQIQVRKSNSSPSGSSTETPSDISVTSFLNSGMTTQQWLQQLRDEPIRLQKFPADPKPSVTVFCVPDLVRSMSPAYHQRKELQLGLHQRSLQTTGTQLLKVDIARALHGKLLSSGGSWEAFANTVVGNLETARGHYQKNCSSVIAEEVVPFLLALDALFLVVFFQFLNKKAFFLEEFQHLEPRLLDTARTLIRSDLLLLENQLPMYLLKNVVAELVAIRAAPTDTAERIRILVDGELDNVLKVAVNHLYPLRLLDEPVSTPCWMLKRRENKSETARFYDHVDEKYPLNNPEQSLQSCKHILDCVYVVVCGHSLPVSAPQRTPSLSLDSIPSASRLKAIGIAITDKAPALNQIKLTGCGYVTSATLSLPKVNIYDFTETVFHNLAVHEQLTGGGDMRCFLQCMASLSNDSEDVALLIDHGVVDDKVGNDGVVGMWNRIMRGVYTPRPSPSWLKCYQDIHNHRRNRVKRWRREAWVLFFSKPWTFLGLLGAVTILFLTAVQTWFTVVNSDYRNWRWPSES